MELLAILALILFVICLPALILFVWLVKNFGIAFPNDPWRKAGEEMAKVPTPPEHLNPPGSLRGQTPIERLKGDYDHEDTFWELCYLTRNNSEAQFRHETRAYMYLENAKDDAIIYKKSPAFYRQIRICQRLKSDEFRDE